jgi:hypothetical protein
LIDRFGYVGNNPNPKLAWPNGDGEFGGGKKRSIMQSLDKYTIPQLKTIAASRGIDLKGVTRKDDIKKRISKGLIV